MPPRITITPDSPTASGTTSPHVKCVFNFDDLGDQLVDSRARLVVYDFEVYQASEMGEFEGIDPFVKDGAKVPTNIFGGPEDNPVDPPLKKGNGVLLKVDGVLRRTRPPKGWLFQPTKVDVIKDAVKTTLVVDTPNEFFDIVPTFNVSMTGEDFDGNPIRLLVFRMIRLTERFGDPHEREVIACNFNPHHNPGAVGPTIGRGAVVFHVAAADPNHPSEIGKDGGLRPIEPPQPSSRIIQPDLTGRYEADPIDETGASRVDYNFDPPLMFHIHQAGNALAGWFAPPQDNLHAQPLKPPPIVPRTAGCFYADSAPGPDGWRCSYFLQSGSNPFRNVLDPDADATELKSFRLVPIPATDPNEVINRVNLVFEERITSGGPPVRTTLRLRRTELTTRLPFALLKDRLTSTNDREKELVREIVQDQVETLPTSFWERLTDTLGPRLLPIVQRWVDASSDDIKSVAVTEAGNLLAGLIPNPTDANETKARLRIVQPRVRALLETIELKPLSTQGETKSAREWLITMAGAEMGFIKSRPGNEKATLEQLYSRLPVSFRELELRPPGEFVYTLHFQTKGKSTPGGIVVGAYVFDMTVKKELKVDDGNGNVTRKPVDTPGWKNSESKLLCGVILQGGAGVSCSFKSLKTKGKGGTGIPGKVEIESFIDIPSADDFDGALFRINAVKIGTFNAVVLKGALVDSAFLQFTLQTGVTLDAVVDASFTLKPQFDWVTVAKTAAKKRPVTKDELIDTAKELLPEVALIQYILSFGGVFAPTSELGKARPPSADFTEARLEVRTTIPHSFDVDSAQLDVERRGWLEVRFAIDRALFEGSGHGLSVGFASPEATEDHNLKLSESRAQAVRLAVQDAFGPVLAIPIEAQGLGEGPARKAGLENPPDPPSSVTSLSAEKRQKLMREKEHDWPLWRKVDLNVDGVVVVRVMGRGARKD